VISKGLPLVFFDRVCESLKASKVVVDDYLGATLVMEHLLPMDVNELPILQAHSILMYIKTAPGDTGMFLRNMGWKLMKASFSIM
jgi:hypothetical protein